MKSRYYFFTAVAVLLLIMPMIAQAHVPYLEPESLVKKNQPVNTAAPWPSVEFGGFDYSFEYPLVFPDNDLVTDRVAKAYLAEGDVDVYTITVEEGNTDTLRAYTLVAGCLQYKNIYPVVSVFGPGLPPLDEELPFEIPEELEGLGHVRTYPVESLPGERPVFRQVTRTGIWTWTWFVDTETEEIRIQNPEGGTYYIVVWNPDGKAVDYSFVTGFEPQYTPEELRQRAILVPLNSGMKTTVMIDCVEAEGPNPFPF